VSTHIERIVFEEAAEPDALELPDIPLLFGRFLVLVGHLAESDVVEALRVQRDLSAMSAFVLIEQGLLSLEEIRRLWDCQRRELVSFDEAMRRQGLPAGAERAAVLQSLRGQRIPLGEILVRQGKISREALSVLLSQHERHQNEHRDG
jgi:hypothetical protein